MSPNAELREMEIEATAVENDEQQVKDTEHPLKFRNYVPRDPTLRKYCLPRPSVEELEKRIDSEALQAIERAQQEETLSQINPKRPNWDLKRDVERKLALLSHRTDKSVVQLIRRSIQKSDAAKELYQPPSGQALDVDRSAETLTEEQRELAQSVLNAMDDLDKIDQADEEDEVQ